MPIRDREAVSGTRSRLYYWTLRRTAKSRESSNSIIVSFIATGEEENRIAKNMQQGLSTGSTHPGEYSPQDKLPVRRFHLVAEHDLSHVPENEDLGSNTDPSGNAGRQINEWVKECDQHHSSCAKVSKSTWVPTRLLDLQFGDLSSVKLVVRPADQGITGPYVTLSHCWGNSTDSQYLRVYVRQLRQKLEPEPERPRYILTETGVGYRLRAPDEAEGRR